MKENVAWVISHQSTLESQQIGWETLPKVKYGDYKVIRTSASSFWAINQQILAPGKQNIEFSNFETSNCKLQLQVWIASSQLSTWKLISVNWVSDDWDKKMPGWLHKNASLESGLVKDKKHKIISSPCHFSLPLIQRHLQDWINSWLIMLY